MAHSCSKTFSDHANTRYTAKAKLVAFGGLEQLLWRPLRSVRMVPRKKLNSQVMSHLLALLQATI
jgi:hypothetical protein